MYLHSWPTISVQLTSVVSLATELQAQAEAHAQMQVIKMIQEKRHFTQTQAREKSSKPLTILENCLSAR